ncbi:MAG TPA: hypothetical protein PKA34_05350 [Blastocatellia bacterium]|nr:hypothetical protein [Blastocatellia bacterium]
MKKTVSQKSILIALCIISIAFIWNYYNKQPVYDKKPHEHDKYSIIRDDHQAKISIGVGSNTNRNGLMRILAKAADEHQSYSERDYMFLEYLWVEAYLVDGDRQSKVPAGKLRRYVPPINAGRHLTLYDRFISIVLPREDSFSITLYEARVSLPQASPILNKLTN